MFLLIQIFCFADINGEAIHASMGLPPALSVTTAKVGKLEIMVCVFLLLFSDFVVEEHIWNWQWYIM